MSVVVYNGVSLPYPLTSSFDMSAVYDESNTDRIYTRLNLSVECLINIAYIRQIDATLVGGVTDADLPNNAGSIIVAIRNKLLEPRKSLSFQCNGVELVPQKQDGITGDVDAKNGPKPKSCSIIRFTTDSFLVRYEIEAHYWEKKTNTDVLFTNLNERTGSSLTCRWTESVTMDNCLVSTRVRSGYYVIRSDNVDGRRADDIRTQLAPLAVPKGFLRRKSSYKVDPDGLRVAFEVEDVEYFRKPPPPAYVAEGNYTETSTKRGAARFGEVRITLKGTVLTDQTQLLKAAFSIAGQKLRLNGAKVGVIAGRPNFKLLEEASAQIDMWENKVTVAIKVRMTGNRKRIDGIPLADGRTSIIPMTYVPNIDAPNNPKPPSYPIRGTANLLLQAAKYFDPNLINHPLLETEERDDGADFGGAIVGFQFQNGVSPGQGGREGAG